MKKASPLLLLCSLFIFNCSYAQGTWYPVASPSPDTCFGVMLLMTDGTVLCKSVSGGGYGTAWDKLTPDIYGSYQNGTWSTVSSMHADRLYFSSQVLRDGRVYVAGGEYGGGGDNAEIYDPVADTWSNTASDATLNLFADANSELLENDKVLQAIVTSSTGGWNTNDFYTLASTSFSTAPACLRSHDESAWLKLPDNSILMADMGTDSSERYIPSLNQWITDANLPVFLYDPMALECGGAVLLPNGKGFFVGGRGDNALYTPSGSNAPGTWTTAAHSPGNLGVSDGACAEMPNGNVLVCMSPVNDSLGYFYSPTFYFEYNYQANGFSAIPAPDGNTSDPIPSYYSNMLVLPDGNILYGNLYSPQYYIYSPGGTPVGNGHPTISTVTQLDCNHFQTTGHIFNGISEGASYGDDWQMATNYPIVRLTDPNNGNVYYVKSYNWNSVGVCRGNLNDTTYFYVPNTVPYGTYNLQIIANGIASVPSTFLWNGCQGIEEENAVSDFSAYPNPSHGEMTLTYSIPQGKKAELKIFNTLGEQVDAQELNVDAGVTHLDESQLKRGVYFLQLYVDGTMMKTEKVVVE